MVNKSLRHLSDFVLEAYTFGCAGMSDFVPNNRHLQEVLLYFFLPKKTAAEAHRELQKVYGDAALSETTCHDWFRRFKDGDFDVDGRSLEGRIKTFEDAELQALIDEMQKDKQKTNAKRAYFSIRSYPPSHFCNKEAF